MTNKKITILILICIVLMAIIIFIWQGTDLFVTQSPTPIETPREEPLISIPPETEVEILQSFTFICDDNKSIIANFDIDEINQVDQVRLVLSDGRSFVLPRAISASGARYAFDDESMVFWNKGTTAFITENGVETFSNCNTQI